MTCGSQGAPRGLRQNPPVATCSCRAADSKEAVTAGCLPGWVYGQRPHVQGLGRPRRPPVGWLTLDLSLSDWFPLWVLANKETGRRSVQNEQRPPCLVGGWFRFQSELDARPRCASSHCLESQTHPGGSEPGQHRLCLPNPPSPSGGGRAPEPPHPHLEQSVYHVLGRGPGMGDGDKEPHARADPPPTPGPPRAPPHTLPGSQTTTTPAQHPARPENIHIFLSFPSCHSSQARGSSQGTQMLPGSLETWVGVPAVPPAPQSHVFPCGNHYSGATDHRNRLWLA